MIKEKINQFLKGEGNNKKKIENLSFFLTILVVTVIAINIIWKDDNNEQKENNTDNYKKLASSEEIINKENNNLESRLEDILSNISGVGKVKVLITYNETEELIPIYNKTDKKSTTNEVDSSGGTRVIEQIDTSEEVVYQNEKIITQKTISPKIEGAIITAQGANNSLIKTNIIQAVEAATGLATHKIQVFEKQN
jgi:stage III sporulation protein AG